MPGIGFLFKKKFHPSRLDNQKRLFVAEQDENSRKERETVAAEEVAKEKEICYYEKLGEISARDPRSSSLKFMYAAPAAKQGEPTGKDKIGKHYEPKIDENGEDDMVRAFKAKLQNRKESQEAIASQQSGMSATDTAAANDMIRHSRINNDSFGASAHFSALESVVGRKCYPGQSLAEQEARHPALKNAPVEAAFVKSINAKPKPFNEVIRNVQCSQCGEWGHRFGDRECQMRDFNPHDIARQRLEDPMTYMNNSLPDEKQKLILRRAFATTARQQQSSSMASTSLSQSIYCSESNVDIAEESDPETEFLATLTTREKKLLLRKLQEIETGIPYAQSSSKHKHKHRGSVSDSDSDSDDSINDDDDGHYHDKDSDTTSNDRDSKKHKKRDKHHKQDHSGHHHHHSDNQASKSTKSSSHKGSESNNNNQSNDMKPKRHKH